MSRTKYNPERRAWKGWSYKIGGKKRARKRIRHLREESRANQEKAMVLFLGPIGPPGMR